MSASALEHIMMSSMLTYGTEAIVAISIAVALCWGVWFIIQIQKRGVRE